MMSRTGAFLAVLACGMLAYAPDCIAAVPAILTAPTDQSLMAGATASFSVSATGTTPLNYQWLKNGTPITDNADIFGATSTNLVLRHLSPADAGLYSVLVRNGVGSTNSVPATLRVLTWENNIRDIGYGFASASSADGVKLVAASAGGGIYLSTNSGATWTLTTASTANWGALASSADGIKLVAAVQFVNGDFESHNPAPMYLSGDSGLTWVQSSAPSNIWYSVASSADGTSLAAVAYGDGIYMSANSGVSWTRVTAPTNSWTSIACSTNGARLVAVADGDAIYVSTDSGVNWSNTGAFIGHYPSVTSSADGAKLAVADFYASGFSDGSIYTSADGGSSWHRTTAPNAAWASIASSADGARLAAVCNVDGALGPGFIYFSHDSGTNWSDAGAPYQGWTSIASSADGNKLVATAQSGAGFFTWPSVPALDVSVTGSGVMVSWPDYALACVLQRTDDLRATTWANATDFVNDDGTNRFILANPTTGSRFYRLSKP